MPPASPYRDTLINHRVLISRAARAYLKLCGPNSVVRKGVVTEQYVFFAHSVRYGESNVLPDLHRIVGEYAARDGHGLETDGHVAFEIFHDVVSDCAKMRIVERDPVI